MEFIPKEEALNNFLQTWKSLLKSLLKFKECLKFIVNNKAYTLCEGKKIS